MTTLSNHVPTTWFTSDTHYSHANIIDYCKRPYANIEEMNEDLVKRWNDRVAPEDTVFHLGDVAMGGRYTYREIVPRLNGHKHLVFGNHDRPKDLAEVFESVQDGLILEFFGTKLSMAHVPTNNDLDPRGFVRPAMGPADIYLCGHVHDSWLAKDGCINVGVDVWNYRPVNIDTILTYGREKARQSLAKSAA